MATIPRTFNKDNPYIEGDMRVEGDLYVGGTLTGVGAQTFTGDVAFAGAAAITGALTHKRNVVSLTAAGPTAITAAQSGSIFAFNRAAGVAVTLPAIAAADVGLTYLFFFETTATGDHTITAAAADLLKGGVFIFDFDAAYTAPQGVHHRADGSDDLIITMNGTTKGGKVGSWVELTALSATSWGVRGVLAGDGTIVTPFS